MQIIDTSTASILKPDFYYGFSGIIFLNSIFNERIRLDEFNQSLFKLDKTDYSFSRGIPGIGWAIQILTEKNILSQDYNYLLDSFDDLIYKDVVNKKSFTLSMFSKNSLLSKSLYLFQRITSSCNKINGFYNHVACKECLILLISEISSVITTIVENNKESKILYTYPTYLLEVGQSFLFLYLCLRANISKDFACNRLRYLRVEIENLLADKTIVINKENSSCLFYLLYIYTHVAIDIKDSKMVNNSHLFYNKLIPILQPLWKDITDFELKKRLDAKTGIYKNATINYNLSDKADCSFYLWDKLGSSLLQEGTENKFLKTLLLRAFLLE